MDSDILFLHPRSSSRGGLFMDLPSRVSINPVADELAKLAKKPVSQLSHEIIAEIDSLHEAVPVMPEGVKLKCAECWTTWPCATHRAIYGETKDNCVHGIRPGTGTGVGEVQQPGRDSEPRDSTGPIEFPEFPREYTTTESCGGNLREVRGVAPETEGTSWEDEEPDPNR